MQTKTYNAQWWNKDNDSAWDNVRDAFRRDWEQTKHDFGGKAPDLNQDVPDTLKQAAGVQPIPPGNKPNFEEYEPAFRFGYGARQRYMKEYPTWNDRLELNLRKDWSATTNDDEWKRYSSAIRRGYDFDMNKVSPVNR